VKERAMLLPDPWRRLVGGWMLAGLLVAGSAAAQDTPPPLWAAEIRTGARWDAGKPPQEQAFFREHSLQRLRAAGQLVMGARYGDKGLVVLAAASEAEARAMMDADPAIKAETFRYELHPFSVFYGGSVAPRPRPAAAPAPR
jgi:uncharacterized protein YciI